MIQYEQLVAGHGGCGEKRSAIVAKANTSYTLAALRAITRKRQRPFQGADAHSMVFAIAQDFRTAAGAGIMVPEGGPKDGRNQSEAADVR